MINNIRNGISFFILNFQFNKGYTQMHHFESYLKKQKAQRLNLGFYICHII